jgi:lipopolysaccharide export system protein LptA
MSGLHLGFAARLARIVASIMLGLAILASAVSVSAETTTNKFGALSGDSKDPIDIESDMLVVRDKEKLATFKGNVKAVQGKTTLQATELDVHYSGGNRLGIGGAESAESTGASDAPTAEGSADAAKKAKGDDGTQITKIEAKGNVVINTQDNQTTTSEWALYDVPSQLVTVGGNVVLTQGENVLKGDRLVIDLKTGQSRFENTASSSTGGRIRALFMPKGGLGGLKPGDAKPEDGAAPAAKPSADAAGGKPDSGTFGDAAPMPLDPMRQQ